MKKRVKKSDSTMENSRRDFLKKGWMILGAVAATELAFFFITLLKPSKELKKSKPGSTVRIIGNIDDFLPGTVTPDRINRLFIVRESDGGFLALSLICPHLGCSVLWDETKKQFDCPCHSSAFDKHGVVLNSPAPRPLDYFPVILEAGKVKVDVSQKAKRRKFETNQMTYAI
jgi:cytochrome b6-f complex iron-sulfur subunit